MESLDSRSWALLRTVIEFACVFKECLFTQGLSTVRGEARRCLPKEILFPHGDLLPPVVQCYATLNELVFKGPGDHDKRPLRVQDCIWSADKTVNCNVPVTSQSQKKEREECLENEKLCSTYKASFLSCPQKSLVLRAPVCKLDCDCLASERRFSIP